MDSKTYTIGELAEAAGVTPRTVRFYAAEGLLPPPDAREKPALYSQDHLNRLNVIQELKRTFLPLHAIRDLLDQKTPEELTAILNTVTAQETSHFGVLQDRKAIASSTAPHDPESAVEYIRRITESAPGVVREASPQRAAKSPSIAARLFRFDQQQLPIAPTEQWERIALTREIEIHARTPRSPEAQRLIDRLLSFVRRKSNP
jgi:DNA-binding transcriptional MerR regulator